MALASPAFLHSSFCILHSLVGGLVASPAFCILHSAFCIRLWVAWSGFAGFFILHSSFCIRLWVAWSGFAGFLHSAFFILHSLVGGFDVALRWLGVASPVLLILLMR